MAHDTADDRDQHDPDPSEADSPGLHDDLSEAQVQEIEEERARRLDPDNRPRNAEVDNTQRDFDFEEGRFLDGEDESDLTDEERAATQR